MVVVGTVVVVNGGSSTVMWVGKKDRDGNFLAYTSRGEVIFRLAAMKKWRFIARAVRVGKENIYIRYITECDHLMSRGARCQDDLKVGINYEVLAALGIDKILVQLSVTPNKRSKNEYVQNIVMLGDAFDGQAVYVIDAQEFKDESVVMRFKASQKEFEAQRFLNLGGFKTKVPKKYLDTANYKLIPVKD